MTFSTLPSPYSASKPHCGDSGRGSKLGNSMVSAPQPELGSARAPGPTIGPRGTRGPRPTAAPATGRRDCSRCVRFTGSRRGPPRHPPVTGSSRPPTAILAPHPPRPPRGRAGATSARRPAASWSWLALGRERGRWIFFPDSVTMNGIVTFTSEAAHSRSSSADCLPIPPRPLVG